MTDTPDPDTSTLSKEELRLLGRLDERTERIDDKVENVVDTTEENASKIATNQAKLKRNTTILGGFSTGLSALLLWSADKLGQLL